MPGPALLTRIKRLLLITFGLIFLALGILGYFLPGLPGTIWLILSASLFVRSSDRLYNFVVQNRFFGKQVRDFLETGAMPLRAKRVSLISIWLFSTLSILFAPYGIFFDIPVLSLAVVGTLYIYTRPTQK